MRSLRSLRVAVTGLAVSIAACTAPAQRGAIAVAPGASDRLLLAMQYGYAGLPDVPRPAEARRAVAAEQLVAGPGATGRAGDWVLENAFVTAVITDADGSARGGQLVDLARTTRIDDLARVEVRVLGRPVRYTTIRSGFDRATGAAWIQVTGSPEGRSEVSVSTRYDLGADLDAVLVHTTIQGIGAAATDAAPAEILSDAIIGASATEPGSVVSAADHVAWLGARAGYMLHPLAADAFTVDAVDRGVRASFGAPAGQDPSAALLYSRAIAALPRPDTAALAVALARIDGRGVGDVAVRLTGGRAALLSSETAELSFQRADGAVLSAHGIAPSGAPASYIVSLPAGSYDAMFSGPALASRAASSVVVAKDRLSTIQLRVAAR